MNIFKKAVNYVQETVDPLATPIFREKYEPKNEKEIIPDQRYYGDEGGTI